MIARKHRVVEGAGEARTVRRLVAQCVVAAMAAGLLVAQPPPVQGQPAPSAPASTPTPTGGEPPSAWTFSVTPYGWLTFISGSLTVNGQTTSINTNAFQMFAESQTLLTFMMYTEARYRDRIGLFADLMYANLTAGKSASRSVSTPGISGSAVASASANYETLTLQFGAAYEVVKVGRDRSGEGPGMAGVGQTAFDIIVGGRWWYQRVDLTLNFSGAVTVTAPNLTLSADRTQVTSRSGSIGWVDPLVGFRVRHHLAPGQNVVLEADLGGFGIGSRLSAQAQLVYVAEFGRAIGIDWAGALGYRALYVDYTQGSGSSYFQLNEVQHGPMLGVRGKF